MAKLSHAKCSQPGCNSQADNFREVDRLFGLKVNSNGSVKPQNYCRQCRGELPQNKYKIN